MSGHARWYMTFLVLAVVLAASGTYVLLFTTAWPAVAAVLDLLAVMAAAVAAAPALGAHIRKHAEEELEPLPHPERYADRERWHGTGREVWGPGTGRRPEEPPPIYYRGPGIVDPLERWNYPEERR